MFVVQVSEMGRTLSKREQGMGLLNFLSGATSGNLKVGWNLLQVSEVASGKMSKFVCTYPYSVMLCSVCACEHAGSKDSDVL